MVLSDYRMQHNRGLGRVSARQARRTEWTQQLLGTADNDQMQLFAYQHHPRIRRHASRGGRERVRGGVGTRTNGRHAHEIAHFGGEASSQCE